MAKRHSRISFTEHPSLFDDLSYLSDNQAEKSQAAPVDEDAEVTPMALVKPTSRMRFMSLGSGSSGNCAYLGDEKSGILIDAGVDPEAVERELTMRGIKMSSLLAVIVTHDHSDHVRYVYKLLRHNKHMQLYCTPLALKGMLTRHNLSRRVTDYHKPIWKEHPFTVGPFEITAFATSHDGTDNCGFYVSHTPSGSTFAVATDLGEVTDRVDYYLRQASHIMLESNYDLQMLLEGPYPEYLKARIRAGKGHLDNAVTGRFLAEIMRPELKNVFLCHLSNDNNTPEKARSTITGIVIREGHPEPGDGSGTLAHRDRPWQLVVLPRFDSSQLFVLDP